jgi:hypothetical protein
VAATEFVTARYPDAEMPRTQDKTEMLARVRDFIRSGDKARIREQGGEWSRWRSEQDSVKRINDRVSVMGVGPRLIVQRESDRDMLSIRELSKVPDLGAAPALEAIHAFVWGAFDVRSGGLWLCRYIDGTRTVSRHGYKGSNWRGAAEDIFVLSGGMPQLVKVGQAIVAKTKNGQLKAATVIVDNDIWTPSSGWRIYSGHRHYHVHTDISGGTACM